MANVNPVYSALSACGFESNGICCFGVWRGYAVTLRLYSGKTYYMDVAVRPGKQNAQLRKAIVRSLKEKQVKRLKTAALTEKTAIFTLGFGKPESYADDFAAAVNAVVSALQEAGLAPADTCALSGAAQPDSLGLVALADHFAFQPVSAAAVRALADKNRERVEDNQNNGSYALGLVGALLGVLVGLIPNLLTIVAAKHIYAVLFALVPIAAIFGYRLFRGKMSKGAVVIVILASLLGVPLLEYLNLVAVLIREYSATLGEALSFAWELFRDPEFLSAAAGDLGKLLLFMALGVVFALRVILSQTNGSKLGIDETQLASLRPNPARGSAGEQG